MPRIPRPRCVGCNKVVGNIGQRYINNGLLKLYVSARIQKRIDSTSLICHGCRLKLMRWHHEVEDQINEFISNENSIKNDDDTDEMDIQMENNSKYTQTTENMESIKILVDRCSNDQRSCIVCGEKNANNRTRLDDYNRNMLFMKKGVYVSPGARCCGDHFYQDELSYEAIHQIVPYTSEFVWFNSNEIQKMMNDFRTLLQCQRGLDFDNNASLGDEAYYNITGLQKDQFNDLLNQLQSMRNSKLRSARVALAVFLAKFRLGLSNRVLATIFCLKDKRTISKLINQVRQALKTDFVPHHIGFNHIDRQSVIDHHQTAVATALLATNSNQLCVVMDGTYLPIQKSSNHPFQRRTYSMHKHKNLVKPMIITATDGYILSVFGPFLADGHNNDASIIKHIMRNDDQGITSWLHDDDIIIVDRGFRDAVSAMEELGLCVEIPAFLKGKRQFSTQEANRTRAITKNRWIIESVNEKIKEWNYFNHLHNSSLQYLPDDLDIVCALHNAFRQPIMKDPMNGIELAKIMLEQIEKENELEKLLMQISDDKKHTGGRNYQIKQSKSYINEHLQPSFLDENELEFIVELCNQHTDLLRVRFHSRHSNTKHHTATVQFDDNQDQPIQAWYCTCASGSRTVGCCVHITAILWHMGVNRGEVNVNLHPLSAARLLGYVDDSNSHLEIDDNDDESNNIDD
ncbi:unnamed protein product [Adineta ricciae]|uniref:SWIM-type domain-containing protein n=1 Tax=Adineta ricciae TaxID=249248 RepID=A0A816FAQ4_ADIRI|nr:unnamed protein product [Adineta ricciae]